MDVSNPPVGMQVDTSDVTVGSMNPGDTYELDGLWFKIKPSGSIGTADAGKSWFVRLSDGEQRINDDTDIVNKVIRKVTVP